MELKKEDVTKVEIVLDSGSCVECDWSGLLKDADIDYDWDEFKGESVPHPICPKCGEGIDDFYPSKPPSLSSQ